jgi:hypothetical protein
MSVPEKFRGYASFSKEDPTTLKLYEYTPKKFEEHDVDIKITHCGVPANLGLPLTLRRFVEATCILSDPAGYPSFNDLSNRIGTYNLSRGGGS